MVSLLGTLNALFKEMKYSSRDLCLLPDRAIGRKGIEMIFWK